MKICVNNQGIWYHGSNQIFTVLRKGSTVTQWKELAEAFSHKPNILCYDDNGNILHTGKEKGYLYTIDENIQIGKDIVPHPNTVMDKNAEFLTTRPLKVKWVCALDAPTNTQLTVMQRRIDQLKEEHEMDFLSLAKKRYSARGYLQKPVEPEKLNKILEAGRIAPTACNNQPQRIIVVQSPEGLAKIGKCCRAYNAPLALIICADHKKAWVRAYDSKLSADIDASIVTDHMMLCAADCGLNSVWVCEFKSSVIREEFHIPENLEPINILFIGYADGEPASPDRHDKLRLPLEDTVFYENF